MYKLTISKSKSIEDTVHFSYGLKCLSPVDNVGIET